MVTLDLADDPFPKRKRFRVRIINAEDANPFLNPKQEDAFQLFPQRLPRVGFEIDGVNVLVLFWRIFGVLNGAIRPLSKPFGMFAHIRVVRRALKRDVECQLHTVIFDRSYERTKIFRRAELWVNCLVSALFAANAPRASDITGTRRLGVVRTFAMSVSDGMDRRQINHVEP